MADGQKNIIVRSSGENPTEKILANICDNAFLKLWVYPNPYKKKGDELCDVLVLFDEHIFIFSVKEIKFNTEKDIDVAWKRWKRKAIDESKKQIERAESWILNYPDQVFLDASCEKQIPIKIDPSTSKIHRIIVAHGAEEACKSQSEDNVYGSLAMGYSDKLENSQFPDFEFPFLLNLPRDKVFHVFDSFNLNIILEELDTITDLTWYFEAKEEAIKKYSLLNYAGEEDLLAHYILNFDKKTQKHFIGSKKKDDINGIFIGEGEWHDFIQREEYQYRKHVDTISYFWDDLIKRTAQNAFDDVLTGNADLYNGQSALKEMAKEPRFMRREICKMIYGSINKFPDDNTKPQRLLSSYPSFFKNKRYVLLQLTKPDQKDYDEEYRPVRAEMLKIACGMEKIKRPESDLVIGIAVDAPKHTKLNSEDFVLLDCSDWNEEDEKHYLEANEVFGFFESKNLEMQEIRTHAFPEPTKARKRKIGRNEKCPCGSGIKYKKCHGKN